MYRWREVVVLISYELVGQTRGTEAGNTNYKNGIKYKKVCQKCQTIQNMITRRTSLALFIFLPAVDTFSILVHREAYINSMAIGA